MRALRLAKYEPDEFKFKLRPNLRAVFLWAF